MLHFNKRLFSSSGRNVVIVGAKRTPIGSFMGQLKDMSATSLASGAARGAIETSGIQPSDIQEAFWGNVIAAGQG
jgi:acetyl-CoA C-acetyltransferase